MQRTNNYLGMVGAILYICGIPLRTFHVSAGSIILGLGFLIFVAYFLIFLISGLKSLSAGLEKASGASVIISMLLTVTGFYFRTQYWPGAELLYSVGQLGLIISGILLITDAVKETDLTKRGLKSVFGFTLIIISGMLFYHLFIQLKG